MSAERQLLPSATEVPFADIESTLARIGQPSRGQAGPRALTGTVVVIGPLDRLFEAADALEKISTRAGIRTVLISHGDNPAPSVRLSGHAIAIDGLKPDFVNNAVAALRLSSLPTLVWWRGGGIDALEGLSTLADRLVLDAPDPVESWRRVPGLVERTAVSDLRWTRLTRWRALMAHFFDVPEVAAAARAFDHLDLAGADRHAMRLFAGWIVSSLKWPAGAGIAFHEAPGASPIVRARLSNHAGELLLALASSGTCVETAAHVEGHAGATRIVSLGDQSLGALMAEELRIRSRDLAFERALASAERLA